MQDRKQVLRDRGLTAWPLRHLSLSGAMLYSHAVNHNANNTRKLQVIKRIFYVCLLSFSFASRCVFSTGLKMGGKGGMVIGGGGGWGGGGEWGLTEGEQTEGVCTHIDFEAGCSQDGSYQH